MAEGDRLIDVWIDFLPNQPKTPEGRAGLEGVIRAKFETQMSTAVDRLFQLPPVMVYAPGEYVGLPAEAREIYTHAHYYSCVAMCGIVGERILKEILRSGLRVAARGGTETPSGEALDQLEHVDVSAIARFLTRTGLITDDAGKAAEKLQQLRNAYAHARGKDPQGDALRAIGLLHALVDGTVSIFKHYTIKDGKLVPREEAARTS